MRWLKQLFSRPKKSDGSDEIEIDDTYHTHVGEMSDKVIRAVALCCATYATKDRVGMSPRGIINNAEEFEHYLRFGLKGLE